jgi:SnoaL-like domain
MPWFPDFVAAAELARREIRTAGRADPVAQYLTALTQGDSHELETTWPGHVVVLDPYAGEVRGHRALRHFVRTSEAFLADHLVGVERVASTSVPGRAVVELLAHLELDGDAVAWPVAVVAETDDGISATFRTYGSQWPVVGTRPLRTPILGADPAAEPSDVIARHLHALDRGEPEEIVGTFTAEAYVQEPIGDHALHRGTAELMIYFSRCLRGGGIDLQACRITDDGVRGALEHNCVRWGGRPVTPQAGLAVFERDSGGLLAGVRHYDDIDASVDA